MRRLIGTAKFQYEGLDENKFDKINIWLELSEWYNELNIYMRFRNDFYLIDVDTLSVLTRIGSFMSMKSIGCIRTESNKLILPLRRITKSFNSEDEVKNCISELRKLRDARIKPDEEIEKIINELKGTAIIEKA